MVLGGVVLGGGGWKKVNGNQGTTNGQTGRYCILYLFCLS